MVSRNITCYGQNLRLCFHKLNLRLSDLSVLNLKYVRIHKTRRVVSPFGRLLLGLQK